MDNFTHALIGLTLNNTLPKEKRNWGTSLVCLVASELPDIDILYRLKGSTDYLLGHRGISHSIPAVMLFAGLITLVSRKAFPQNSSKIVLLLASGCLGLHILFDIFTSWGTQFLTPFYGKWFHLDYLPIVDLVIIAIALFFMFLSQFKRINRRKAAFLAVVFISGFIMVRGATHMFLVKYLQSNYPNAVVAVLPGYSPLSWKGILEYSDTLMKGDLNLLSLDSLKNVRTNSLSQEPIEKYVGNSEFERTTNFFRKPIYTILDDRIVVKDFYYDFREVVFPLDGQGKITGRASSGERRSSVSYNL